MSFYSDNVTTCENCDSTSSFCEWCKLTHLTYLRDQDSLMFVQVPVIWCYSQSNVVLLACQIIFNRSLIPCLFLTRRATLISFLVLLMSEIHLLLTGEEAHEMLCLSCKTKLTSIFCSLLQVCYCSYHAKNWLAEQPAEHHSYPGEWLYHHQLHSRP